MHDSPASLVEFQHQFPDDDACAAGLSRRAGPWVSDAQRAAAPRVGRTAARPSPPPQAAHIVLPWVRRAFSNAKTWALGVYHGLRKQHLQSYLDEFVFRFNRRRTRRAAFRSLLATPSASR
jgi:hypothetical protein